MAYRPVEYSAGTKRVCFAHRSERAVASRACYFRFKIRFLSARFVRCVGKGGAVKILRKVAQRLHEFEQHPEPVRTPQKPGAVTVAQ